MICEQCQKDSIAYTSIEIEETPQIVCTDCRDKLKPKEEFLLWE